MERAGLWNTPRVKNAIQPHPEETTALLAILSRLRAGGLGVRSGVERKGGIGDPGPGWKDRAGEGCRNIWTLGLSFSTFLCPCSYLMAREVT